MKYASIIMLLLLAILCSAYPTSPHSATPERPMSSEETSIPSVSVDDKNIWLSDYDYMWEFLDRNYPYMQVATAITGKDYMEIKNTYRIKLESFLSRGELSNIVFLMDIVKPILQEFEYTGHLSELYPDDYNRLLKAYATDNENPKSSYLYQQICKKNTADFYSDVGAYITSSNLQSLISDNLEMEYYPELSIAYIKIHSMLDLFCDEALISFFSSIEAQGYQNCVIDIQENGGGSDSYWTNNIVNVNLRSAFQSTHIALIKGLESIDYYKAASFDLLSIERLDIGNLPELSPSSLAGISHFVVYNELYTPTKQAPLFSGRFWVLTSQRVYSSSEKFAIFCKETGFATLVGTQTSGDGIGMNPMIFALPNTGLCIQFCAGNGLNADGSCSEEVGTSPDILVSHGEDAFQICINSIIKGATFS